MLEHTVAGHMAGLRYETVRRQPGQSDAERKLEELTRQLEVEMTLGSSPTANSLSPSQRSPAIPGVPSKQDGPSLSVDMRKAKHNDLNASSAACRMCLILCAKITERFIFVQKIVNSAFFAFCDDILTVK